MSTSQGAPRINHNHQSYDRSLEQMLPQCLPKGPTLPTPRFWTYNFQNCQKKNLYRFMPPGVWYFVTATLGNEHRL